MAAHIDPQKLQIILLDALDRLLFLEKVKPDDELSSELAGYQISKLLKDQAILEQKYAELVEKRTSLVGITKKPQLNETQNQIHEVATNLKESTKKLCRLFKENPDLEKDGKKVKDDIAFLRRNLEQLNKNIMDGEQSQFYKVITKELDNQDKLRKIIQQEKELIQEKKRLEQEKAQEYKEYQNDTKEVSENIQIKKEKLVKARIQAEYKKNYSIKDGKATIHQQQLIYENKAKEMSNLRQTLDQKTQIEKQSNDILIQFLHSKQGDLKEQQNQWSDLKDKKTQQLDDIIQAKIKEKEELEKKLKEQQDKQEQEKLGQLKQENEEKELSKQKQESELAKIKLDNAIRLIQTEYNYIMDMRGGFGKKKKSKKAKKKK